jgi:hypothetical protein
MSVTPVSASLSAGSISALLSGTLALTGTNASGAIGPNAADSQSSNPLMVKVDAAVAGLLGISTSTLQSDLASGQTMASLASSKGVSSSSLISAISSVLASNAPQGGTAQSASQLAQMATNIADGHRGGHHHRSGGSSSSSSSSAGGTSASSGQGVNTAPGLSQLAALLNIDPSTLTSSLGDGTSIADMLAATSSSVIGTIPTQGTQYDSVL